MNGMVVFVKHGTPMFTVIANSITATRMIGSETDWAAKKRRQTLQAANSPLSIGESGRDTTGENLPIEKEIDKDKEKDKDSNVIAYDRTCNLSLIHISELTRPY